MEIPSDFLIQDCSLCGEQHAPIRACSRVFFRSPTGAQVGTETYYQQAMDAGFYGVEDDGRAFTN